MLNEIREFIEDLDELGLTRDDIKSIEWEILHEDKNPKEVLEFIDDRMKHTFGVEALNIGSDWDKYYGNIQAYYVNMGDTYTKTVLYDIHEAKFLVTSWGDWYEDHPNYDRWRNEQ